MSDKPGKTKANRSLRKRVKNQLKSMAKTRDESELLELQAELPLLREASDVWTFPKDGKHLWVEPLEQDGSNEMGFRGKTWHEHWKKIWRK